VGIGSGAMVKMVRRLLGNTRKSDSAEPLFLIYQMGKVGSLTIEKSLTDSGFRHVVHTHKHNKARKLLRWNWSRRKVVVITGFREPLRRCISAYFQNFSKPPSKWWYIGETEAVLGKSVDWLIDDFNRKAPPHVDAVVRPWLNNFMETFHLQSSDFRQVKNHWKAERRNIEVFVYKLETMQDFLEDMGAEPIFRNVSFTRQNDASEKWSGKLYADFVKAYRITRPDYERVFGNIDYVDIFYDRDEVHKLISGMLLD
jgi:hypothetical protein